MSKVYVQVPKVSAKKVKMHRVSLIFPSHEKWFYGGTLQEAAQKMVDHLDSAGWHWSEIEKLVKKVGADPWEVEY